MSPSYGLLEFEHAILIVEERKKGTGNLNLNIVHSLR
jgi:hypothetical protein